jgi:hypothetical protein
LAVEEEKENEKSPLNTTENLLLNNMNKSSLNHLSELSNSGNMPANDPNDERFANYPKGHYNKGKMK